MDTIKCIKTRRSRRKFLDKPIPKKVVEELLSCAVCAPSSVNCQPWHFIIVENDEIKVKLSKLKEEDNQEHILTAPVLIVVCVNVNKSPSRWVEDGVTATENVLLAAHALGLGAVYVTGCKNSKPEAAEKIREILCIPSHIVPFTILPVGFPDPSEKLKSKNLVNVKEITRYV